MIENINGIDIYYELNKVGSNTLVIMFHGLTMSSFMYPLDRLTTDYLKMGYDVLSFDFIAHGKTGGKSKNMTISEEIKEAKHMIDLFKDSYKELIFIGHSQGGIIASFLASIYKPKKLFLLAPAFNIIDEIKSNKFFYKKIKEDGTVHIWNMLISKEYFADAINENYYKLDYNEFVWIHGESDILVSVDIIKKYENAHRKDKFHIIGQCDHEFIGHYDELLEIMKTFS